MEDGVVELSGVVVTVHNTSSPMRKRHVGECSAADQSQASTPTVETPIPQARIGYEQPALRCGIYPREIEHRKTKRKSYRTTEA